MGHAISTGVAPEQQPTANTRYTTLPLVLVLKRHVISHSVGLVWNKSDNIPQTMEEMTFVSMMRQEANRRASPTKYTLPPTPMHAHQVDRRRHKLLTSGIHISDCNCRGLSLDQWRRGVASREGRKWELCTEQRERERALWARILIADCMMAAAQSKVIAVLLSAAVGEKLNSEASTWPKSAYFHWASYKNWKIVRKLWRRVWNLWVETV